MRLEKLEIENFKCFKSKKAFDFSRITILTGANSSGKSTVMQAVLGAVQTDGFPFFYSPNGKYENLGDFTEMFNFYSDGSYLSRKDDRIKFQFRFLEAISNLQFSMKIELKLN